MAAAKTLTIVDRWEGGGVRGEEREKGRALAEKEHHAPGKKKKGKKMNSGMDI